MLLQLQLTGKWYIDERVTKLFDAKERGQIWRLFMSQNIVAKIFVCMYVQACWPMLQTDVQGVGVCPLKSHIILTPYPWQTKDSCMAMQE